MNVIEVRGVPRERKKEKTSKFSREVLSRLLGVPATGWWGL